MGKRGSICCFDRALPASIWAHCSQILAFTSSGGAQKGRDNDSFRAVFPSVWPNTAKQGKMHNDKLTLFCPSPEHITSHEAIFRGGPKWHSSDLEKMHFGGFGVPGLCSRSGDRNTKSAIDGAFDDKSLRFLRVSLCKSGT